MAPVQVKQDHMRELLDAMGLLAGLLGGPEVVAGIRILSVLRKLVVGAKNQDPDIQRYLRYHEKLTEAYERRQQRRQQG